jgi:putative ABC transport system permease protein
MSFLDRDHWREIFETLRGNKLRTFLTAFGVFWGIFMLMVMLGSGNGLWNGVQEGFSDGATNSLFVWSQATSKPWRGMATGREIEFTMGDTEALLRDVPEIGVLCPRNQLGGFGGGNNAIRGTKAGAFNVNGDFPQIARLESIRISSGRFLDPMDLAERRKVAVIGMRVRELLFERNEDPLGQHIRINGVYFRVIGVFRPRTSQEGRDRSDETIFVPFTTFQTAFNFADRVGWFAILPKNGIPSSVVEEKVITVLKERHRVAPDDQRAIGHFNLEEEYSQVQGLFTGIRVLVWIVGIGTLAAGVIGVSNIMLVIVRERTNEIGIRRAVGATPFTVAAQVVFESIVLTSAAGYLGLVFGILVVESVAMLIAGAELTMFKNPEIPLASALQTLVVLVVSGVLAGLIPAARAVRVHPVEALRGV